MAETGNRPAVSTAAVRGAVQAEENSAEAIGKASRELMLALMENNSIGPGEMISVLFTATPDLDADFPATAAREAGLSEVPLICAQELPVVGALPRCLRVMIHAETTRARSDIRHVYLRDAILLRSDLLAD